MLLISSKKFIILLFQHKVLGVYLFNLRYVDGNEVGTRHSRCVDFSSITVQSYCLRSQI